MQLEFSPGSSRSPLGRRVPDEIEAETFAAFLEKREEDARHEFLARSALSLLGAHDISILHGRITQAAIPEISDWCILDLWDGNAWHRASVACRFEEEAEYLPGIHAGEFPPKCQERFAALLEGGAPHEVRSEEELSCLRETLAPLSPSLGVIVPLGTPSDPIGCLLFAMTRSGRDFTETRLRLIRDLASQVEEALRGSHHIETLRKEVKGREKLISIASHELKTPLTAMRLSLELMRREYIQKSPSPVPPVRLENFFRSLERSIDGIAHSVDTLFSLSEVQSGQITLTKAKGDLSQLLKDVSSRMEPLLERAGCSLVFHVEEPVFARFDAPRLEQVITNLLSNAAKYAPRSPVEICLEARDGWGLITVRDHGPGIPAEERDKIFEAFSRGEGQSLVKGLGLGLFITRGIVQAHGGTISVRSEPGEGSEFIVKLPLWLA